MEVLQKKKKRRIVFPKFFKGHKFQQLVWECQARFIDIMAGRRGGKDHIGIRKALKNIARDFMSGKGNPDPDFENEIPRLHYWFVAPTYPMTKVILRHLMRAIPKFWVKKNRIHAGSPHIWLRGDILIEFKSANNPNSLVGEGLNGIYITETARLKPNVWNDNLRPTLTENKGWAIFTTTPLGRNWYIDEIRDVAESGEDQEYAAFFWRTVDNDCIPGMAEEVERARKTMPSKYFKRNYEANPDAFHGQIYDDFSRDIHIQDFEIRLERYKHVIAGLDWGYTHNGVIVVVGITKDDVAELIDCVSESKVLAISTDPDKRTWLSIANDLTEKWNIEAIFAGPDEPDHIAAFRGDGLSVFKAKNSVSAGIQFVAQLMHADESGRTQFRIHKNLAWMAKCFTRYSWKVGSEKEGAYNEAPEKVNDDEMDAVRYCLYSAYRRGYFTLNFDIIDTDEEEPKN